MASSAQVAEVDIAQLVAAIEAKRKERLSVYEKEKTQYDKDLAAWRKQAVVKLREVIKRFEAAKDEDRVSDALEDLRYGRWTDRQPNEPRKPDFTNMDRDLKSLKLMVDSTIKLRTDSNFFNYL